MSESAEFNPLDQNQFPPRLTKAAARQARRQERSQKKDPTANKPNYKALEAKTERQRRYIQALKAGESVIAIGGAGTGKTYIPSRLFAKKLIEAKIERLIIARVTASRPKHALGFLPGKLEAKLAPWLVPVIEGVKAEMNAQTYTQLQEAGKIEFASFEHMRGRTFAECCVLLDEAQNADYKDLKMVLTRWGENAQYAVTGDVDQIDVDDSGLETVVDIVETHDIPIHVIEFTDEDVVRSPMAKAWVKAFSAHEGKDGRTRRFHRPTVRNLDVLPAFIDNGRVTKPVAS
ncbi:putative PhoH-like protein [Caulobacter phage CcrSwift]|uniref:PhoH-like protein n=6 Tax=Viruses TaxID=10239 RepID=K4JT63_9CAUD|nr:PhoH-like phosphate starvation-inducible [Caulobacter phage phiCbK]YP_006988765.1 PhoH-like phosphate starvation-inducible [Caulobacter virus Magneto]YP_006989815.1 PhoH-like phosphate starvation-inducible [Caulobacter phage CcrSwift]ARB14302.1 phosphate starvation-inducible protein [Caulobacter phage Ccr5]ARB15003.1 phosphate starvation-inducible protein [Caulobacter phage Ccr32]ARB15334.1 phosphate starvation-inducible protein [Caulobacter phage Ccr34]AFO71748.1 PhoH family protein [Caul